MNDMSLFYLIDLYTVLNGVANTPEEVDTPERTQFVVDVATARNHVPALPPVVVPLKRAAICVVPFPIKEAMVPEDTAAEVICPDKNTLEAFVMTP
jgi:hypothetical protein